MTASVLGEFVRGDHGLAFCASARCAFSGALRAQIDHAFEIEQHDVAADYDDSCAHGLVKAVRT